MANAGGSFKLLILQSVESKKTEAKKSTLGKAAQAKLIMLGSSVSVSMSGSDLWWLRFHQRLSIEEISNRDSKLCSDWRGLLRFRNCDFQRNNFVSQN